MKISKRKHEDIAFRILVNHLKNTIKNDGRCFISSEVLYRFINANENFSTIYSNENLARSSAQTYFCSKCLIEKTAKEHKSTCIKIDDSLKYAKLALFNLKMNLLND